MYVSGCPHMFTILLVALSFATMPKPAPAPETLLFGFHNASWSRARELSKGLGTVVDKPAPGIYKLALKGASESRATHELKRRGAKYAFPWSIMNVDSSSIVSVKRHLAFLKALDELAGEERSEAA